MKIVAPPKPIHTSEIVNDEIIITIPVKKRWAEIIWLLFFLVFLTYPLYLLGKVLILFLLLSAGFYGDVPSDPGSTTNVSGAIGGMLMIAIILLVIYLWTIYSLLWRFAGREIVSANKDLLVVTRKLFGWKSYKAYKTSDISALRIWRPIDYQTELFFDLKSLFGHAETIAFDYGARSFRFANGLDEAEGRQIIREIQSHLPGIS
jgi:hypothetical protein